jgi:cyclophilin family peptidyl-prolyl cis-trans isomerase
MHLAALLLSSLVALAPDQAPRRPAAAAGPFKTPLTAAEMTGKQAVVETSAGTFIIDLRPDLAPNHVGYFLKMAREGAYANTTFHRVVRHGIIQGGDPLSKDPSKAAQVGTGGLGVLQAERSSEPFGRGAVGAALRPGQPDSAGAQFFVCVTEQPALAGQFTLFGRVSDGLDVVQKISEVPADAKGAPETRVTITSVTIRDTPPPEPVPFANDTPEQLAQYRAVLDTTLGSITIGFTPGVAPEHVRNFLQLAQAGVLDGTTFHRVVRGFVVQTGALNTRGPLTEKQQKLVHNLQPEFNPAGAQPSAGVQPGEARQRHRVDGARRRSGERDDVLFHRHGGRADARRQVHGFRPGSRGHGCRRSDRGCSGERGESHDAGRAQGRPRREIGTVIRAAAGTAAAAAPT